jgi:outer membrane protein TolC
MKFYFSLGWMVLLCITARGQEREVMSLQDVKTYAIQHAPGLQRQRLTYSNRVESVVIAKAKYDPVLSVRRGWEEENDPGRTVGTVRQTLPADLDAQFSAQIEERNGEEFTRYALQLSKTILGGGSFKESRLPINRARILEAKEANNLSLEQRRLSLTLTRQFYQVLQNYLTLQLRQQQLAQAKINLEHAIIKEDPLDIATAELRIPEREQEMLSSRRAIEAGLLELKDTMGMPLETPMTVQTQLVFQVQPIDEETDLLTALSNHETIRNARLDAELSQLQLEVADTKTLPELRLDFQVEQNDSSGSATSESRGEVVLEWPWMDRVDRAEARQRLLEVREQEIRGFEARQQVRKDVESGALEVAEAEKLVELQEKRMRVLERQFLLYEDRWENGEINILEYVRSQNDMENARVELIRQQIRYLELRAEYDFVIGQ